MTTRNFRKVCLIFGSAFLLANMANSQGTSFGIRGGVNFQNINGKDASDNDLDNNLATRFHAGIQADIPIAPQFYFQPGLLFSTKGAKQETVILEQTVTSDLNISYLELPLNFLFKPALGNGHFLLGVGPYLAYGIGGKAKYEGRGISDTQDVKFENNVTLLEATQAVYVRPFDAGANLFVGYQFGGGLFFQFNTQLGLLKINPEYTGLSNDDSAYMNTGFGFSAGFGF